MASTLLRGGRIRATFDGEVLDAIGVRGGRVVAPDDGPFDAVLDLDGAWVIPGLVDTHPHLLHFAAAAAGLADLADVTDHAGIVAALHRDRRVPPAGRLGDGDARRRASLLLSPRLPGPRRRRPPRSACPRSSDGAASGPRPSVVTHDAERVRVQLPRARCGRHRRHHARPRCRRVDRKGRRRSADRKAAGRRHDQLQHRSVLPRDLVGAPRAELGPRRAGHARGDRGPPRARHHRCVRAPRDGGSPHRGVPTAARRRPAHDASEGGPGVSALHPSERPCEVARRARADAPRRPCVGRPRRRLGAGRGHHRLGDRHVRAGQHALADSLPRRVRTRDRRPLVRERGGDRASRSVLRGVRLAAELLRDGAVRARGVPRRGRTVRRATWCRAARRHHAARPRSPMGGRGLPSDGVLRVHVGQRRRLSASVWGRCAPRPQSAAATHRHRADPRRGV